MWLKFFIVTIHQGSVTLVIIELYKIKQSDITNNNKNTQLENIIQNVIRAIHLVRLQNFPKN